MTKSAIDGAVENYLAELAQIATGHDRARVIAAVAKSVGAVPDLWLGKPIAEVPESPQNVDGADLIGLALQAITDSKTRSSGGLFYTPRAVADAIVSEAFRDHPLDGTVCDPTCGGGSFLLAAARWAHARGVERCAAVERVRGIDIDPVAAGACRTALGLWAGVDPASISVVAGDGFEVEQSLGDLGPPFDAVVGNPPFQSQLGGSTVRSAEATAALRERFGAAVRPYVDTGALFLLEALDLVNPSGVVAMIVPLSVLATRDVEPIRRIVTDRSALSAVWVATGAGFDAKVNVCAVVLRIGAVARSVRRLDGAVPEFEREVPIPEPPWQWSEFAADQLGVPQVLIRSETTLRTMVTATAGFRDEYYALAASVVEGVVDDSRPRLITSGLVEVLESRWGIDEARFAKQKWRYPVVDPTRFAAQPKRLRRWLENRLVPKLLVATQTRTIEAIPDLAGQLAPITPVISVEVDPNQLWLVAAVLTNPISSIVALRRTAGSARSAKAIKLSARQLLDLPLPIHNALWDEGAALAEAVAKLRPDGSGLAKVEMLTELGKVMCGAYGVEPDEPFSWWSESLGFADVVRSNSDQTE
ncbi:MAG: N-6 DNA methylase [Acidimicrobiales bacterium]